MKAALNAALVVAALFAMLLHARDGEWYAVGWSFSCAVWATAFTVASVRLDRWRDLALLWKSNADRWEAIANARERRS